MFLVTANIAAVKTQYKTDAAYSAVLFSHSLDKAGSKEENSW
jgi:hypothetical protein